LIIIWTRADSSAEERLLITGYTREPRILNHELSPVTDIAAHFNEVNTWPTDYTDSNSPLKEMLIQFALPQFQKKFSGQEIFFAYPSHFQLNSMFQGLQIT
jgi:hypothetical protein